MHDEDFPVSAIDQERNQPATNIAPSEPQPGRVVAGLLPQSEETAEIEPISAEEVARQTPPTPGATPLVTSASSAANNLLRSQPRTTPSPLPNPSALASVPQPDIATDLTRNLKQQIDTTIRVQRELKIEIEDDVEQLAQRTSEYLTTQLDQRDAQLMERIAQQINQHPTRQATLSGPGTSVGS